MWLALLKLSAVLPTRLLPELRDVQPLYRALHRWTARELAKRYGGEGSGSFVAGILGKIIADRKDA